MKLRRKINFVAAIFCSGTYLICTALACSKYPLPFSPWQNWLSDLGNQIDNPQGAIYYNVGVILTAVILAVWFTAGLNQLRLEHLIIHRRLLTISQTAGILSSIALIMSALYPINNLLQHAFWSQIHFMMFSMGFGFSVAALRFHPNIPRAYLYVGSGAAILPALMFVYGEVYWLEWIAVGLFIAYILSVGKASLSLLR